MLAAKGKGPPPPRLRFAWWCLKYNLLPKSGSMAEQDYREMYLNDVLPNIYSAVSNWRANPAGMDPSGAAIIMWLAKQGLM